MDSLLHKEYMKKIETNQIFFATKKLKLGGMTPNGLNVLCTINPQ
jgi:hypothetical protein